jgi:hypothetical protein
MRKLLKRWYFWLGLVLLLGFAGGAALIYANPSRITQANFDRIHKGMSWEDVLGIMDEPYLGARECFWEDFGPLRRLNVDAVATAWQRGPDWISVGFDLDSGKVVDKEIHLATTWETLTWYAKKGAEKIGIKWN